MILVLSSSHKACHMSAPLASVRVHALLYIEGVLFKRSKRALRRASQAGVRGKTTARSDDVASRALEVGAGSVYGPHVGVNQLMWRIA